MAVTINADSSSDDDSEDTDDSDEVIFTDWKNIDTAEHQTKVKAFLKKISSAGKDAREMRPFLKSKSLRIGDMPNPWGIRVSGQVNSYDNPRQTFHRNDLGEAANPFIPAKDVLDPTHHPLHPIATSHGYEFSHTTRDGFHIWNNGNHLISAPFNDTKWATKTNAAASHTNLFFYKEQPTTARWRGSMAKIKIKGVKAYVSKGKTFAYHRKTGTRLLNPFGTAAFFAELAAIEASMKTSKVIPKPGTWGGLVVKYKEHRLPQLARRTQADYHKILDWLSVLNDMPLPKWNRGFAIQLRDKAFQQHGRRFANYVIAVGQGVFTWGLERNYIHEHPIKDIKANHSSQADVACQSSLVTRGMERSHLRSTETFAGTDSSLWGSWLA